MCRFVSHIILTHRALTHRIPDANYRKLSCIFLYVQIVHCPMFLFYCFMTYRYSLYRKTNIPFDVVSLFKNLSVTRARNMCMGDWKFRHPRRSSVPVLFWRRIFDRTMWMTEFFVTLMLWACVTLGFCISVEYWYIYYIRMKMWSAQNSSWFPELSTIRQNEIRLS
jgi:hypothetical protein